MPGKTLLIIEPHASGHRAIYVRAIAMAALARGLRVALATTQEALGHPVLEALQHEAGTGLHIFSTTFAEVDAQGMRGAVGLARQEFRYRRLLRVLYRAAARAHTPDVVLVPYLDYCLNAIALCGAPFDGTPWAAIAMRPAFHFAPLGIEGPESRLLGVKRRLFLRLLTRPGLQAVLTIDEALHHYVQRLGPDRRARVHYLPDPAVIHGGLDRAQARERLSLDRDSVMILVYGSIDARKGLDALLAALDRREVPDSVSVYVAGRQDEAVRRLLQEPSARTLAGNGRLRWLDGFMNAEEEYAAFKAADIAWLGYRGHYGMSGVLVQAGMMGLPTIACAEGLVGWMTARAKSGVTVRIDDAAGVADAISRLARDRSLARTLGANGRNRFAQHTVERFSDTVLDALAQALA